MSTYRNTSRARHSDERIQNVGPVARAVWDYLCCNQQDHASGLYRLSIAAASEDTGWSAEQIETALRELEFESLIERDVPRRLVWVRNMLHKSYPKLQGNHKVSVERHLREMPRTPLVARLVAYYADRYGLVIDVAVEGASEGLPGIQPTPGEGSPEVPARDHSVSVSVSGTDSVSVRPPRDATQEPPTAESRATERHVENEGLRERLTLTGEVPQPRVKGQSLGNLPTRPNDLRKLLDAGYAFDEIVATAVWLSERITAGEILPAAWSGAFYGGWHDSFRQRECPEKFNAKPKGPRGPVDPSTQRHDVPPEF
jgi:hypothetical protein